MAAPRKVSKFTEEKVEEFKKEKEVVIEPIWIGTATTNLNSILKGEKVKIFEDKDNEWLTEKGLISKLYLLLEKP